MLRWNVRDHDCVPSTKIRCEWYLTTLANQMQHCLHIRVSCAYIWNDAIRSLGAELKPVSKKRS